jgi:two-component system OmpR family response regulator
VLARLRALIRRASGSHRRAALRRRLARSARREGHGRRRPVKLTSHEFRVLSYLMHHRGRVVSQAELSEHIYAENADRDSNTVEVFIGALRRKLGAASIETCAGSATGCARGRRR